MKANMNSALQKIRDVTSGTKYENHLYIVGGAIRDKVMGRHPADDIDIVYEGDALELAEFLHEHGAADHRPVTYPRFGTAMVMIEGTTIELVSARRESYASESRKPNVEPASLYDDILRRDFTINTLIENIHSGEMHDLTELGVSDIVAGIIRTPKDPEITFYDDPLRMLRAIRFAVRYKFVIDEQTYGAIVQNVARLDIISSERIRDEFVKIMLIDKPSYGLKMLKESDLLKHFAPELLEMTGVSQSGGHIWDVWDHTLHVLDSLPVSADLTLRLAALFHDTGKPSTKIHDKNDKIHFYGHEDLGSRIAYKILDRLRFPRVEVTRVSKLVAMHMRIGEYRSDWKDSAIKRLMHDAGRDTSDLLALAIADRKGSGPNASTDDLIELEHRMENILMNIPVYELESPLDGDEIMRLTGISPGPEIRRMKKYLLDEIIEGRLSPGDKETAGQLLRSFDNVDV